MTFVCQVNFATAPELAGFPTSGLLQWFVGSDDTLGLTFDDTQGTVGFHVNWIGEPAAPSTAAPGDPTPAHKARELGDDIYFAIDSDEPVAMNLVAAQTLPHFTEAGATVEQPTRDWAHILHEDPEDIAYVWEEYVRGASSPFGWVWQGSNMGGTPTFTQHDDRGTGNYAAANHQAGRLLIELDAADFFGWGDAGIGHLFGDPSEIAAGNTTTLRYHWDCT